MGRQLELSWTHVKSRKHNRKSVTIMSDAGNKDDSIQPVKRKKYISAWPFKPEIAVKQMLAFLNKKVPSLEYTIYKCDRL